MACVDLPALRVGDAAAASVDAITERLRTFAPAVEPAVDEPGVFWLDVSGLGRLYRSPVHWARTVVADLGQAGLPATVVVGFTRFCTYAVARARGAGSGVKVFRDPASERDAAHRVPLARLDLDPELGDVLGKLGVFTVGEFVRLPPGGVLTRFGAAAGRLHALAAGESWDPLRPRAPERPLVERVLLDDPETDVTRLLFVVKRALDALLATLAQEHAALATLFLDLELRGGRADPPRQLESIRPAAPTLDARSLLVLVSLRLEASPPPMEVTEILLSAEAVPATSEQLSLFAHRPRRDLGAADQALARLRAELGDQAVVVAALREGHLPEASYAWQPLERVVRARPRAVPLRPLVRRVYLPPQLLPPQDHHTRDDGWLLHGLEHGPVVRILGPYIVSGGWWQTAVHREYHFAETRRGRWLWVYYDRRRRRWFLHGRVE
jgi:protein ImuB